MNKLDDSISQDSSHIDIQSNNSEEFYSESIK